MCAAFSSKFRTCHHPIWSRKEGMVSHVHSRGVSGDHGQRISQRTKPGNQKHKGTRECPRKQRQDFIKKLTPLLVRGVFAISAQQDFSFATYRWCRVFPIRLFPKEKFVNFLYSGSIAPLYISVFVCLCEGTWGLREVTWNHLLVY